MAKLTTSVAGLQGLNRSLPDALNRKNRSHAYFDEDLGYDRYRERMEDDMKEEAEQEDPRVVEAKEQILRTIDEVKVVTDREVKVRLEERFFPWVTGRALGQLVLEGNVESHGYAGRRRMGKGVPE